MAAPAPDTKPTPLAVERCQGPSLTMAAACPKCAERSKLAEPASPWLDVRLLVAGDVKRPPSRANVLHHFVAARLPAGWWACAIGREGAAADGPATSLAAAAPATADRLPGGGAELTVEVAATTVGEPPRPQLDVRRLYVCGVGPSRAPACASLETYRFAGEITGSRDTSATFKDGMIVLEGTIDDRTGVAERYRVVFP